MACTLCTSMYSLTFPSASPLPSSLCLKTHKIQVSSKYSQMGLVHLSTWSGLKHVGISISAKPMKVGKCRGKIVYASLFGVGAPEALVIGVVALLVFGPKGLAEVARNLGKTLRSFQPTIRELQEVSKEFKSTLEREIGLDDDPRTMRNTYDSNRVNSTPNSTISSAEDSADLPVADPNGIPSSKAYSSEEYLKITEEQLKASAATQQEVTSSPSESLVEPESLPQGQQHIESPSSEWQSEPESQPQASQQDLMPSPPDNQLEPSNGPEEPVQESTTSAPLADTRTAESQS